MEGGFNRTEFNTLLYTRLLDIFYDSLTEQQAEDAYWAVNFMYTPWPYLEDEELNRKAFIDVIMGIVHEYKQKLRNAYIILAFFVS